MFFKHFFTEVLKKWREMKFQHEHRVKTNLLKKEYVVIYATVTEQPTQTVKAVNNHSCMCILQGPQYYNYTLVSFVFGAVGSDPSKAKYEITFFVFSVFPAPDSPLYKEKVWTE